MLDFDQGQDRVESGGAACASNPQAAFDGKNAQELLLAYGFAEIDLLITDLNMPGMQGDELAEWYQKEKPGAKVLLMPTNNFTTKLGVNTKILRKPFQLEILGEIVRKYLQAP